MLCVLCRQPVSDPKMLRNGRRVCKACILDRESNIKKINRKIHHIKTFKKVLQSFVFIVVLIIFVAPLIFIENTVGKVVFVLGFLLFVSLTELIIKKFGFLLTKLCLSSPKITNIVPTRFSIKKLRKVKLPIQEEVRKIYAQYWELPPDWQWRRQRIIERYKGECQNCGSYIGKRGAHVHHKIPKAKTNGNHSLDNLTLLCGDCHSKQPEPGHSWIKQRRK